MQFFGVYYDIIFVDISKDYFDVIYLIYGGIYFLSDFSIYEFWLYDKIIYMLY